MCSVPHANERRKLAVRPEIDVGSDLPLTSFDVTPPGLAAVKVDNYVFQQPTSHSGIRLRERQTETAERLLKKPLVKTRSVVQIWTLLRVINEWGLSNTVRGSYFASKVRFFSAYLRSQVMQRISLSFSLSLAKSDHLEGRELSCGKLGSCESPAGRKRLACIRVSIGGCSCHSSGAV